MAEWFNIGRARQRRGGLQSLKRAWTLQPDRCPCDVHFVEWMQDRARSGERIFHFGTGSHHHVGTRLASEEFGSSVLGITATASEHDAYVELVSQDPDLAKRYTVYFGDIYLTNEALLPEFDVVTLFHLCEFRTEANDAYGGMTDAKLLEVLAAKTRQGGHLLFYTGSYAYARARPVIEAWAAQGAARELGTYKSLSIFEKA